MIWAYDLGWFVAIDAMKVLFTAGLNLSFPTFGPKGAVWLNVRLTTSYPFLVDQLRPRHYHMCWCDRVCHR